MIDGQLDGVVGWVVGLMDALGAPGVGVAIALENVFPPLPSEVFLPLAGSPRPAGNWAWSPRSPGRRSARSSERSPSTAWARRWAATGCWRWPTGCRW
jgi:hypothetical protein